MNNKFLEIINNPMTKASSVTRFSGVHQNNPEDLTDHIFDVSMMSYLISRKLISLGCSIDIGNLLQRCLVHDMDEVLIGDIPRLTKYSSKECHRLMNDLASKTAKVMSNSIDGTEYTFTLWDNSKNDGSLEGLILTVTDMLSVAKKTIIEVEFYSNLEFLKIAEEIQMYLDDISDKIAVVAPPIAKEYLAGLVSDAKEVMIRLMKDYKKKYELYGLHNEYSYGIIEERDK